MNVAIISGSARPNSQTIRVAAWIERQLVGLGHEAVTIDLSQAFVPEDASSLFDEDSPETKQFLPIKQLLNEAEAVVIVSPEWAGMPPGKLVTFFQCVGDSLAHKPALMVSDSATRFGGAYPSEILRGHAGKNTRILWLPEYVIIRRVEEAMQDDPVDDDAYIQTRLANALGLLEIYARAIAPVRSELLEQLSDYPNGM